MTDEEQRLRFLGDLLLSSSPGQFDYVLKKLETLLSASSSSDLSLKTEWIEKVRTEYNSKRGAAGATATPSSHGLASSLQEKLTEHSKEFYSSPGVVSTSVVMDGNQQTQQQQIVVKSYSERVDVKNYHGGSWFSEWQIDASSSSIIVMSGKVQLMSHSYEEGRNFCLDSRFDLPPTTVQQANSDDCSEAASAIVNQIQKWESTTVLPSLVEMHGNMTDLTLRSLRRVMPITRTKMDWNVVNHRAKKLLANNPVHK